MDPKTLLASKAADLSAVCRRHRVRRLTLFGSATTDRYVDGSSDLDLLVDFEVMPPSEHAAHFFGLQEDLGDLLGASIDLVERKAIRNPYFTQAIEQTLLVLYEAA